LLNVLDLLIGKEALKNLPELPKLKKVSAWDENSEEVKRDEL
jgi:hypothetical protein